METPTCRNEAYAFPFPFLSFEKEILNHHATSERVFWRIQPVTWLSLHRTLIPTPPLLVMRADAVPTTQEEAAPAHGLPHPHPDAVLPPPSTAHVIPVVVPFQSRSPLTTPRRNEEPWRAWPAFTPSRIHPRPNSGGIRWLSARRGTRAKERGGVAAPQDFRLWAPPRCAVCIPR